MRIAILTFPGTWSDRDCQHVLRDVLHQEADLVWHRETDLSSYDAIVVPGGFSYGDYLRCGAIARFSPVMEAVKREAERGKLVFGSCNGFQILCEAGLLPGALMRNAQLTFTCHTVPLVVESSQSLFTAGYAAGETIHLPVAHHDGNYFADETTLDRLEGEGRVAFRYGEEVNGSQRRIAGVLNDTGTVLGMMPHPERAIEPELGGTDGRGLFESAVRGLVDA